MVDLIAKLYAETLTDSVWLRDVLSAFDVVTALSDALTPTWSVEREVDPAGDLSIIVLPECDESALPGFVLYEDDGLVQVATVVGDAWKATRIFPTCQCAVAAILAAARKAVSPPASRISLASRPAIRPTNSHVSLNTVPAASVGRHGGADELPRPGPPEASGRPVGRRP